MNDVVAHVGTFCRASGLHFFCPHKEECVPSAPKPDLRTTFWTTWTGATNHSRDVQRWTKTQWGTHLDDLNGLLKIALQHWLRRLWVFVQKPVPSVLQEGSWIYVLWSPLTPYVYVGQTGAIKGTKMLLTRYLQHLRCGRSWQTLLGKKGVRGLGKLYPEMFKRGPHTFGIVPLEFVSRAVADSRKQFWIRKLGKCLNVRVIPPTTRKRKLLFHGKVVTPRYTKAEIARLVNTISSTVKCNLPIHTQLPLLTTAQKHLSGPARNRCYQKVALCVKHLTGVAPPNVMPLRVPCMRGLDKLDLLPLLGECISSLPIPVYYRAYLKSACRIAVVRNRTVADLLSNSVRLETVEIARQVASSHRDCQELSKPLDIPLVDGHISLCHRDLLKRVFGVDCKILLQQAKNDVIPAWCKVRSTVVRSLRALFSKVLPEPPPHWTTSAIYTSVLSRLGIYIQAMQPPAQRALGSCGKRPLITFTAGGPPNGFSRYAIRTLGNCLRTAASDNYVRN